MWNRKGIVIIISVLRAGVMAVEEVESSLSGCTCEEEENIMQCQEVSDALTAVAYVSISLEFLYFTSCSHLCPFRWVIIQLAAFFLLCGLTHLVNVWAHGPHSFQVMLALTILKVTTAVVSCATAITLVTLIPELLRVKVRELFLAKKAKDLAREMSIMKKREEKEWHAGMLTQEIRSSLDAHTILDTTLAELAKALNLKNCAIWMPAGADDSHMELTHELKRRLLHSPVTVPSDNPDVGMIKSCSKAVVLEPDSALAQASNHGEALAGPMAACIRLPLPKATNFKGGISQGLQASYAILALVLSDTVWTSRELDIVEVVAEQATVALSHAAVLEESQQARDQLVDQSRALQRAWQDATKARRARHSFQLVLSHEMRTPMHSISVLSSILQAGNTDNEQRVLVNMLARTSSLLLTVVNDIMNFSLRGDANAALELQPFRLPVMLREAADLTKHMCERKGLQCSFDIGDPIPDCAIGDERRILQIILHMVGNVANSTERGAISVGVRAEEWHLNNSIWRPSPREGFIYLTFEIKSTGLGRDHGCTPNHLEAGLGYTICERLVQLMHGNIWIEPGSEGAGPAATFSLRLQLQTSRDRNDDECIFSPL